MEDALQNAQIPEEPGQIVEQPQQSSLEDSLQEIDLDRSLLAETVLQILILIHNNFSMPFGTQNLGSIYTAKGLAQEYANVP